MGYEIAPFDSSEHSHPDFAAYRVAPAELGPSFMIRLVTPEGMTIAGSDRQARVLPSV